ncbi:HEPN domain-containing protein [candidate division KSB1 bacterium]|nr:HEPN domain-containing protein [candidate division KSB1 bacterium]
MNSNHIDLAFQWLKKADNDIVTAKQTLLLDGGPTDTVCFHAQQAVEKAMKALLTFNEISFPRIHDLLRLLELALQFLPELEKMRTELAEISNYAVEVRYPDDWFEPSRDDALQALEIAKKIVKSVKQKIQNN